MMMMMMMMWLLVEHERMESMWEEERKGPKVERKRLKKNYKFMFLIYVLASSIKRIAARRVLNSRANLSSVEQRASIKLKKSRRKMEEGTIIMH
jgi:hypothetical protein